MMRTLHKALPFAALLLAAAPLARASGYSIYEQDAEATGQAGAVAARADNAAANFYNPAGLATQESSSLSFGGTLIRYGAWGQLNKDVLLVDQSGATPTVYGRYAAGRRYDLETRNFFPINVFLNYKLSKTMAFGFGAFAPYGLGTQWGTGNNPYKYMASTVDIRIIDYSPSFAMSLMDGKFSWGFGLDYYSASAVLDQSISLALKNKNLPSPPYPPGIPAVAFPRGDNTAHLDATGHKFGAHLGLKFKFTEQLSLGLVYRTKAKIKLDGNASFNTVAGNVGGAAVTPGQSIASLFPNQAASTGLPVPQSGALALAWTGKTWEVESDLTYSGWKAFDSLTLDFSQTTCLKLIPAGNACSNSNVLTDKRIRENWKDTWAARVGAKWKGTEHTYLGFGLLYDQNPVPDETVRSLLPDANRTGVTFGVGTRYQQLKFDFSVMFLNFQKRTSNPQPAVNNDPNSATFDQPIGAGITEHQTLETLSSTYRASAMLYGFNLGYRW